MSEETSNFLQDMVERDLAEGRYGHVLTRFPPEPNGFLHLGHAKSICLNFGIAERFGGKCNLRMDDTNPTKEDTSYVTSIAEDVKWLGFAWEGQETDAGEVEPFYASDYFEQLYEWAEKLVLEGKAYVDSVSREELRQNRGTLQSPGVASMYRDRSPEENLDLLRRMRAGEFEEGSHVLRAKIDLASPNMLMRDPLMYRIMKVEHHRQGDKWCIYPMYDYAHGLSDAIEGITHSFCTLEFENNRDLYDWFVEAVGFTDPRPYQHEFARLALDYTVMSKRKLLQLVEGGHVSGWDDPRMPTLAGVRRRGVRPTAIRAFADMIGVAKANSTVDIGKLEFCIREDLDAVSPRVMAVLDPLEVVIESLPEGETEWVDAPFWPKSFEREGERRLPLTRRIYIERSDFMEDPPKDFYRLKPGGAVRLRYGYVVTCERVEKNEAGEVVRLICRHDTETRHGEKGADRARVRGTIHWVSAEHGVPAEVRVYDRLFVLPDPDQAEGGFLGALNPESLQVKQAICEPYLAQAKAGEHFQFERQGYFYPDEDHAEGALVFNKVVGLRDTWARRQEVQPEPAAPVAKAAKSADAGERERPVKLTRAEIRERRFAQDPALKARVAFFVGEGASEDDAELLSETHALADYAEKALAHAGAEAGLKAEVTKWMVNELLRVLKDSEVEALKITPDALFGVAKLVHEGKVSSSAAKQVFEVLVAEGGAPEEIATRLDLGQISDAAVLREVVTKVVAANPKQTAAYREGKTRLIGFFVGQVMKETAGRADPALSKQLAEEVLGEDA